MKEKEFAKIAEGLASKPDLLLGILETDLSLPNIPMTVKDGGVFWKTLAKSNGYKLQQNMVFKQARILDRNGVRIAWGTVNGMEKALDRMLRYLKKYDGNNSRARR